MRKFLTFTLFLLFSIAAFAHCDGLDGPVVKAARAALSAKNVNRVLIWVEPRHESELRQAFTAALKSAGTSTQAQVERQFFEIAVRLHRESEGASFDGLKPAGQIPAPLMAADHALELRSPDHLLETLPPAEREKVSRQFEVVLKSENYGPDDLAAGREYVRQYVTLLHMVEHITSASDTKAPHPH